ncbi:MAG: hypothetical protein WCF90_03490 [Methanomicrobiales archaeon]
MQIIDFQENGLLCLFTSAVINECCKQALTAFQIYPGDIFYYWDFLTIRSNKHALDVIDGFVKVSDQPLALFCKTDELVARMAGDLIPR